MWGDMHTTAPRTQFIYIGMSSVRAEVYQYPFDCLDESFPTMHRAMRNVDGVVFRNMADGGRVRGGGKLGMAHQRDGPALSLGRLGVGHRAVCGGGHHLEVMEEELALTDNCLHVRQTWRAPENVNRASMESVGGGTMWDS